MRTVIFRGKEVQITKRLFQFVMSTVKMTCGERVEFGFTEDTYQYCLWMYSQKRRGLKFVSEHPLIIEITKVHNDYESFMSDKRKHQKSRIVKYFTNITNKEYRNVSGLLLVEGTKSAVFPTMNIYKRFVQINKALENGECECAEMQYDYNAGVLKFSVLEKGVPHHLLLYKAREVSKTFKNKYF